MEAVRQAAESNAARRSVLIDRCRVAGKDADALEREGARITSGLLNPDTTVMDLSRLVDDERALRARIDRTLRID